MLRTSNFDNYTIDNIQLEYLTLPVGSMSSEKKHDDLVERAQKLGIRYFLPTYSSFAMDKRGTLIPVTSTRKLMVRIVCQAISLRVCHA